LLLFCSVFHYFAFLPIILPVLLPMSSHRYFTYETKTGKKATDNTGRREILTSSLALTGRKLADNMRIG
jgi:hypothetical protein